MRLLSKPLSVSIERPAPLAYEVLSVPENFPRWTSDWIAEKAEGPVTWCLSDRNAFGVLDFAVRQSCGRSIYVPLRVVAKGKGCRLVLTLFRRPDMSEEEFAAAAARAQRDLLAAKGLVETQPVSSL